MARQTVRAAGDSWKDVLAAVRNLQELHRLGSELLEKYPIGETSGQRAMQREAAVRETNTDKLFKARVFADPKKGYSPRELSQLCAACKEHRRALGFTFITKFLTVPSKIERRRFQQQVIAEGWSLMQVKLELNRRYGHRRQAGKRPKISTVAELLAELGTRAIWWGRLHRLLDPKTSGQMRPWTLTLADIPVAIRKHFVDAVKAVGRLEQALKTTTPGKSRRRAPA